MEFCSNCFQCKINISKRILFCTKNHWPKIYTIFDEEISDHVKLRFRKVFITGLHCPNFEGNE